MPKAQIPRAEVPRLADSDPAEADNGEALSRLFKEMNEEDAAKEADLP
jgi:hypothetical protein